jgi:hypothetical protein
MEDVAEILEEIKKIKNKLNRVDSYLILTKAILKDVENDVREIIEKLNVDEYGDN